MNLYVAAIQSDECTRCIDLLMVCYGDVRRTHLIWLHWNNGAQCKDEWVDILHVKVVSGDSIGY